MERFERYFTPQGSQHTITLLMTDAADIEPFTRTMADRARAKNSDRFSGGNSSVYLPIQYVAPYERDRFDSLKRLIVAMRDAAGMRSAYCFRGTVCLDASAWQGHWDEDLFQVLLKYLYDCCSECALVICVHTDCPYDFWELEKMCLCIGFVTNTEILSLEDKETLSLILNVCFEQRHTKILGAGRELLVSALHEHAVQTPKYIQVLDRTVDELCRLMSHAGVGTVIKAKQIQEYLANPHSTICRLVGQPLLGGEKPYELQL